MDPTTFGIAQGAAGSGLDPVYVDDVFSTYLYDGNGSDRTITNGIDLAGEGGIVWTKCRNDTPNNEIDYIDGTTRYSLYTDLTNSASITDLTNTSSYSSDVDQYNSDGYRIKNGGANTNATYNSRNYVSWTFRKAPGFFDVVTYTGTGSATTIAHNLGSTPGFIIVKRLDVGSTWRCWHRSLPSAENVIHLNENGPYETNSAIWNSTAPTSTHFSVGTNSNVNANGSTYVAYLFAHDEQSFGTAGNESIIKCGSYTGSTSSVTVDLGFEPQWVMIKRATGSGSSYTNWGIYDNMRGISSGSNDPVLSANLTTAEGTDPPDSGANYLEINPTGFTADPLGNQYTMVNTNSQTFIYVAIRRPHKPPSAATDVFNANAYSGTGSTRDITGIGFPIDANLTMRRESHTSNVFVNRLTGLRCDGSSVATPHLATNSSSSEVSAVNSINATSGSAMDGYTIFNAWSQMNASGGTYVSYSFRRAPGFFDMVAYEGTGSARTINHNLGAVPKMMIVKKRDTTESWSVYHEAYGNNKNLWLNDNSGGTTNARWNNTTPTDSVFSVGTDTGTNSSGADYIAYLFGDVSGISKLGSYTGTATNGLQVDCGFTNGARFVMVKRYGGTGGWFVWDTARGIVAGNDPYSRLNYVNAEDTTTDYIDPLNSGFIVNGSSSAQINASGGTYIFLAIA